MSVSWSEVAVGVISGCLVAWPVFFAGLWFQSRALRGHLERTTERQTAAIAAMTAAQTEQLSDPRITGGGPA